jgi:hypothetical protein
MSFILMAIFHLDTCIYVYSGGIYALTFGKIEQCDQINNACLIEAIPMKAIPLQEAAELRF